MAYAPLYLEAPRENLWNPNLGEIRLDQSSDLHMLVLGLTQVWPIT